VSLYTYRRTIPAPAVDWFRDLVEEVLRSPQT